jgi:inner membrane protein
MMGRAHLVISTGVTLSVLGLTNQDITLPVIAVTAVSSLLPDIDEPNSLLVSRAIPTRFLRLLQILLIGLGLFVQLFGTMFTPWNTVLAVLVGLVSFMPTRTMRNIVMILIGIALICFGDTFIPWNFIIGSILIVCALVPHRGLTHTAYGVIVWSFLLFCATYTYGNVLWIAGGLSYLLHLLCDALTNTGIRPIPPLKFRLKLKLMSTGTLFGSLVENVCIGLTFILIWFVFLQQGINLTHLIS